MKVIPLLLLLTALCSGQDPRVDPSKVTESGKYQSDPSVQKNFLEEKRALALKNVGPGKFQIGQVIVDKKKKTLEIPATFEVTDANLEYALVQIRGKIHESLLITDVNPAQLHYGVQLLEAAEKATVRISISWTTHGPKKTLSLSDLIQITTGERPEKPKWFYRAHLLAHGSLAAQSEHSLISLINDPSALIHHQAAPELNRDDIYLATTKHRLPKKGLPVTITLDFAGS